jgi:hypothetical protein
MWLSFSTQESDDAGSEICSIYLQDNDNFLKLFEDLSCEAVILYILNSCREQNMDQCVTGTRSLPSTLYICICATVGSVVSAHLLVPRELHCNPCQQTPVSSH